MIRYLALLLFLLVPGMDALAGEGLVITVHNPHDHARPDEVIAIPWNRLRTVIPDIEAGKIRILLGNTAIPFQILNIDGGSLPDAVLFQADIGPGETLSFVVNDEGDAKNPLLPPDGIRTHARFVPERMDDFAWENDLTAFRMYGPALREGAENCGVDCWLKRVPYPIVDKWYRESLSGKSYHTDHGEGHDPYHVGGSLGCGGSGIWYEGVLHRANVYRTWKVLADGPIRTVFELTYGPTEVGDRKIVETRRCTLDLGSPFFRVESVYATVSGDGRDPEPLLGETARPLRVACGLTTHDGRADSKISAKGDWIRCWEELSDGLGTGIILDPRRLDSVRLVKGEGPDTGHLMALVVPDDEGRVIYHAGYGWKRAGRITSPEAWDACLTRFSERILFPIEVRVGSGER